MNEIQLSQRLAAVAAYVPDGARLADIGTDHAYLPCRLAQNGQIEAAIAADVVIGPLTAAKKQIAASGVGETVKTRLADGLEAIEPDDHINTITICGMGGDLIARILDQGKQNGRLDGVTRLVLQPNNAEHKLRRWLQEQGFVITTEEIMEENGKIYEILVAEPTSGEVSLTQEDILFGPFLRREKSPLFVQKWEGEIRKEEYVLKSLQNSRRDVDAKQAEVLARVKMIKEAIT